ncbi:MAG: hypothetical protein R6U95_04645 [Bacteroidales bacterium]
MWYNNFFSNKLLVSIVSAIVLAVTFSCDSDSDLAAEDDSLQNHLIQPSVELLYEYNLHVPQEYWFMKGFSYKDFLQTLLHKTVDESVQAYYPFTQTVYSKDDIASSLSYTNNTFDDLHTITHLVFNEEWKFDTAHNIMRKQVQEYSIVKIHKTEDSVQEVKKTLLASYRFDEQNVDTTKSHIKLLGSDITYEVPFDDQIMEDSFDNFPVSHVTRVMVDEILSGNQPVYVFTMRDSLVELSQKEVRESLGERIQKMDYLNENTGKYEEMQDTLSIDYSEIKGFVFIEDWYVNTQNMYIYKKVKGYAPVREFSKKLDDDYYELVRTIPCFIYLSDTSI